MLRNILKKIGYGSTLSAAAYRFYSTHQDEKLIKNRNDNLENAQIRLKCATRQANNEFYQKCKILTSRTDEELYPAYHPDLCGAPEMEFNEIKSEQARCVDYLKARELYGEEANFALAYAIKTLPEYKQNIIAMKPYPPLRERDKWPLRLFSNSQDRQRYENEKYNQKRKAEIVDDYLERVRWKQEHRRNNIK